MTPIAEFSKKENLTVEETIALVRKGVYSGRLVDGEWFVDEAVIAESEITKTERKLNLFGPFLKGCIAGLCISLVFGLLTYPWERPTFEGASGYHAIMMILATPIITIGAGIAYWLFRKIRGKLRANRAEE